MRGAVTSLPWSATSRSGWQVFNFRWSTMPKFWGNMRIDEHFPLGILAFGIFPQNFGIVLQRKLNTCQPLLDVADHGSEVTAPRIKTNVDATPEILAGDDVGAWLNGDVSNVFQLNVVAPRRVDQEFTYARCTLPGIWCAPHLNVIGTIAIEDVADLVS